jgi:hypothetical protein
MSEDVDSRSGDRAQQAFGLVTIGVEMAVHGCDDAGNLEAFAFWNIEGAVLEDLDLEALEDPLILNVLVVPAVDSLSLEANPLAVEARGDLQAA